jgi:poly-gamma-glutamate biosynthesis protein PgsC/CapC
MEAKMMLLDPSTVSIGVGLVVSLLFTECFGLAAGGMIVPGYLALSLDRPADIGLTLAAALATYLVVALISKTAIVYGRRRTVLTILFGFLVGSLVRAVPLAAASWTGPTGLGGFDASVVGFIIPGLIALWMERQGIVPTCSIVLTSAVVVRLTLILFGMEAPA